MRQIGKEVITMTLENLNFKIGQLIQQRAAAHGNEAEQARLNTKLDKLYEIKHTALVQKATKKGE